MCLLTEQVLCVGSLVHPEIHIDKPPPGQGALFKGDLLGEWHSHVIHCDGHVIHSNPKAC